jgi:hypothetical protein
MRPSVISVMYFRVRPVSPDLVHDLSHACGDLIGCADELDGPVDSFGHELSQGLPEILSTCQTIDASLDATQKCHLSGRKLKPHRQGDQKEGNRPNDLEDT